MDVKVRTAATCFFAVLALQFFYLPGEGWSASEKFYLQEVAKLAALEKDYFQKKINNDLKGVYSYQHPEFKKHVSVEEFQFFDGRVVYNYRMATEHHISGGLMPSLAFIKANPVKKDALGFPQQRKFRWFANPFITVQNYDLKKISISEDGNYAMVAVELKARERLNPAMVRGDIEFDTQQPFVDYWEKVDGKWKITLLADAAAISGGSKVRYFIPNNNAGWEKTKFIVYVPRSSIKNRKK
ncbi:MAG: hypothetical protein NPINA01_16070 [Nitrospinaceae bacterium]|nr:MAG: hypothetical protein NPINA01_16070 [Nitrospinaceae bacterium]